MKARLTGHTARFWSQCSSCFVRVEWPDVLYEVVLLDHDPHRFAYVCRECRDALRQELQQGVHSG